MNLKRLFKSKKFLVVMVAIIVAVTAGSVFAAEYVRHTGCHYNQGLKFTITVGKGVHQYRVHRVSLPYGSGGYTSWRKRTCNSSECRISAELNNNLLIKWDKVAYQGPAIKVFSSQCT